MKKTEVALTLLLAPLIISVAGVLVVEVAWASPRTEINASIQIDSPKNITYTTESIPLNVVVTGEGLHLNYTVAYQVISFNPFSSGDIIILGDYFDDGTPDVFYSTLDLEQDGQYALRVRASFAMVEVYDQIYFTMQTNPITPSPTPQQSNSTELKPATPTGLFPTTLVIIIAVTAVVIGSGFLVYFKKRKSKVGQV